MIKALIDKIGGYELLGKNSIFDFLRVFGMIKLSNEGRGRSAHGWSSHMRVGSLSRIGAKLKKQGTLQKNR